MDRKLLADQGLHARDDGNKPGDDPDVQEDGGSGKEKKLLTVILKDTVDHFFPRFNRWLKNCTDIRKQNLITYRRESVIWSALVMLITRQGSRKTITDRMRDEIVVKNLRALSRDIHLKSIPHGDTVEYLLCRLKESELEKINTRMIQSLVSGRVLERDRLLGQYYMIAIDGVHVHTFDYEHCPHCLRRKDDHGNQRWMHQKLQASLVTETGLCLPVVSEWIENEKDYQKQDCEINALKRLVRRLRKYFPRLPVCLLLDGLYAKQPVFDLLKELNLQWIVVFKEGSMSYIYPWVMDVKRQSAGDNVIRVSDEIEIGQRRRRTHEQRIKRSKPRHDSRVRTQESVITFKAGIQFSEDRSLFNVMTCKEEIDGKKICDYVWLVSDGLKLCEENVERLVKAGRCRWNIENQGFNTLKNGGYHFKHLYSHDEVSLKVWHALINIAHLISQLIERGSLITKLSFGSFREIAQKMFEHLRYFVYVPPPQIKKFQIRLCWDSS